MRNPTIVVQTGSKPGRQRVGTRTWERQGGEEGQMFSEGRINRCTSIDRLEFFEKRIAESATKSKLSLLAAR